MDIETCFEEFAVRDWQDLTEGGPIRLAVIGLGGFSRNRALPAIEESTFCETTVLVSSSPDKADRVATTYGADHAIDYGEFHDGTAIDAYDAVYIATPPAFHLEYAETAAAFDKHVLCEKPMAVNADRAERMVRACEAAGVTLMVAYRLQTEPAVRRMRECIHEGFIGEPVQLHGGFSSRLLDYTDGSSWRLDPDLAGGGALIDIGIYPLNTSRFLLDVDPIAVTAETTSRHEAFADVDEHVAFQLTFPEGVTASCTASFNAHPASKLQAVGTNGQILIESPFGGAVPQDVVVERGDMRSEYTGPPVDEVVEEFDYFAHCLLTDMEPEPDGADGVADLRAIEAAYESAETGARIEV